MNEEEFHDAGDEEMKHDDEDGQTIGGARNRKKSGELEKLLGYEAT